jgi:hypothetical protein
MSISSRNIVLLVAALCAIAAQGRAAAQPTHPQVIVIQIDSVLAADTNQGVDPQLGTMGPRLKKLFNYTTYHLVSAESRRTEMGKMIEFTMPGGRVLHIEPRSVDGNMIAMEVLLFQGEKPMLTTDLKLPDRGRLIVGGPRYQQGALIITIGANMVGDTASPGAVTTAAESK